MPASIERPRRGANKSSKLSEIVKPRGFERNLELETIVGAATDNKIGNKLMFLLRWSGCAELDLLPASEVNERYPRQVIEFYESRSSLLKKCARRRRIQEQADLDLLAYPPTEAPVVEHPARLSLEDLVAETVATDTEADAADDGAVVNTTTSDTIDEPREPEASASADQADSADPAEPAPTIADEPQYVLTVDDKTVIRMAAGRAATPTMDEDPNDAFLSEVASVATEHQARIEALPEDIEMPNVEF